MQSRVAVTTTDNPYNPFTEWDEWYFYDLSMGYHTCERLASIVYTSDQLSDDENNDEVDNGINELMKIGAFNKNGERVEYKKVYSNKPF